MKLRESENLTKFSIELGNAMLNKNNAEALPLLNILKGSINLVLQNQDDAVGAGQILALEKMLNQLADIHKFKCLKELKNSASFAALVDEAKKVNENPIAAPVVVKANVAEDKSASVVVNSDASTNPFASGNMIEASSTNPFDPVNLAHNTAEAVAKSAVSTNPFDPESLVEAISTSSDSTTDQVSTNPFDDIPQSPFHKKEIFVDAMQLLALVESVKSELSKHQDENDVILSLANGVVELAQESIHPIIKMHSELTHLSNVHSKQSKILEKLNDTDHTDFLTLKAQFENGQEMLSQITKENQATIAEELNQLPAISQSITLQSINAQREIAEKDIAKHDSSLKRVDSALKTLSNAYSAFVTKHSKEEINALTADFESARNEKRAEIQSQKEILTPTFKALEKSGALAAQRAVMKLMAIRKTKETLKSLRDLSESTQDKLNDKHRTTADNITAFLDSTVEKNKQTLYEAHLAIKSPVHKLVCFIYDVEVNFEVDIKKEYKKAMEEHDAKALGILQLQIIEKIDKLKVQYEEIKKQISVDLSSLTELAQTDEYRELAEQKIRELNAKLKMLPKNFSEIEMVLQHNAEKVLNQVDRAQLMAEYKPSEPSKFAIALQKFKDFIKGIFTRKPKVDDSESAKHLISHSVFAANAEKAISVPQPEPLNLEALTASASAPAH